MSEHRVEHDSMGDVNVPARAYYGAQTQRAVENFPISGTGLPAELIHALGLVKWAAGIANRDLGKLARTGKNRLSDKQIEALLAAARKSPRASSTTNSPSTSIRPAPAPRAT